MKKIISTIMTGLLLVSACACKSPNSTDPQVEIKKENALIYNGTTEYKIVVSDEASSNDMYAVQELNALFSEATGVRFETVTDEQVTYDANAKYISIGANDYAESAGITIDDATLKRSGFVLKTVGNSYFLSGREKGMSFGSIYAVYDFLSEFLDYEYYAPECYTLTKNVYTIGNKQFDKTEIPDFDIRSLMFGSLQSDSEYRNRMRLETYNSTDIWVINGHSTVGMAQTHLSNDAYMDGIEFTDVTPATTQNDEGTEIQLSATAVKMSIYESYTLKVDNYTGEEEIEWSSSDESVAEVEDGVVKAFWTGTTTITAKADGVLLGECTISVDNAAWYTADGKAVCWTSEGLKKHYIRVIKSKIDEKPNGIYVQLGQADNNSVCNCAACVEATEKYMNFSGIQMVTLNYLSDKITPWLEENYPDREIWFNGTAYNYSEMAPCVWDETQGKYVAYHEDIVPRKNVTFQWCPINMDYAALVTDSSVSANAFSKTAIDAWTDLIGKDKITMWAYCTNFKNYFLNYPNFYTLAENYQYYHEKGVRFFIDQGPVTTGTATFEELRIYLQSKLMWDSSLNINDLIDDFMKNYYGVASDQINSYFQDLNTYYAGLMETTNFNGLIYDTIGDIGYWPFGLVSNYENKLKAAIETVQAAGSLTNAQKQGYVDRIKRLNLTNQFLYLSYYQGNFTQQEISAMLEEFEYYCNKYNIRDVSEGGSLAATLNTWKQ